MNKPWAWMYLCSSAAAWKRVSDTATALNGWIFVAILLVLALGGKL